MDTREKIRQFILATFYVPDPGRLADDTSLLGTGIVDSGGMLDVIEHVESDHGVAVEEREVSPENFDTIARIADFVARKKGAGAAGPG